MAAVQPAGPLPMMTTFSGMNSTLSSERTGVYTALCEHCRGCVNPRAATPDYLLPEAKRPVSSAAWRGEPLRLRGSDPERAPIMHQLTDLREILRYVPQFRERVFVIALDGAVVEDEN